MFLKLFSLFLVFHASFGLNIDSYFERSSILPPTVPLEQSFILNPNAKWYMVMSNKYEIVRTAEVFLGKDISQISEKEIANPCMACTYVPVGCVGYGKRATFNMIPSDDGRYMDWSSIDGKIHGKSYTTMTDNKSFLVGLNYWDGKHIGWSVTATTKSLDLATRKKILDHIKAFGFDLNQIHEEDFSQCSKRDEL